MNTGKKAFGIMMDNIHKDDCVLDLGCGKNAPMVEELLYKSVTEWSVVSVDIVNPMELGPNHTHVVDDVIRFMMWQKNNIQGSFDHIWCSHVMEHMVDVHGFIQGLENLMWTHRKPALYLTVPPRKDELVGGHLTLWTPLLLCYNFIVRGWDLSEATILIDNYDISLITKYKRRPNVRLNYDKGDIEVLAPYFPCGVYQGINGFSILE